MPAARPPPHPHPPASPTSPKPPPQQPDRLILDLPRNTPCCDCRAAPSAPVGFPGARPFDSSFRRKPESGAPPPALQCPGIPPITANAAGPTPSYHSGASRNLSRPHQHCNVRAFPQLPPMPPAQPQLVIPAQAGIYRAPTSTAMSGHSPNYRQCRRPNRLIAIPAPARQPSPRL